MLLHTPECNAGWHAPDFTLKDPHGNAYTMSEHLGDKGLVVAFICNHCPYVKAIAERLAADAAQLKAEGIQVLAVMANDYQTHPEDAPEKMKAFAEQHAFSFPYLIDEDQSVASSWGAVCTPDFFGLNKDGELQYRGRLDDAKMEERAAEQRELVDAMLEIGRTGQGPVDQHPSMGCSIKWRD